MLYAAMQVWSAGPGSAGAHPHTASDSGRAKLLLCLDRSAGERRGISDRTSKNITSLVFEQFGRLGSDALPRGAVSRCAWERLKPELQTLAYNRQCANIFLCPRKMTSRTR
jgi:hypothetical protein